MCRNIESLRNQPFQQCLSLVSTSSLELFPGFAEGKPRQQRFTGVRALAQQRMLLGFKWRIQCSCVFNELLRFIAFSQPQK